MKRNALFFFVMLCITVFSSCKRNIDIEPETASAQTVARAVENVVDAWRTTGNGAEKLTKYKTAIKFAANAGSSEITITVNEDSTYQVMDGFGAAMTGSSAYLMNKKMKPWQREALMTDLFTGKDGNSGIRLSFIRHTIGASDFSLNSYTYNDMPQGQTDPTLDQFSLGADTIDVVPMLLEAKEKNADLKLMGSPWSAPAWMKETYTLNGSWLKVTWYKTYANYLVKYLKAYEAQGLPVYAITLQNEPLHETSSYPSMRMDPGNQISFVNNDLGPAFKDSGITTKIIVYDHNWDRPDYPIAVLSDPTTRNYVAGSAFHAYYGDFTQQSAVHNAFPTKDIWFTEITGSVGSSFAGDLKWNATKLLIGATRNWAKSILLWNLALDQKSGPRNGADTACRGVVTIDSITGKYTPNVEYYVLGHISKFVDPGAVRIFSDNNGPIENVAFKNPDGSKVLIALNNSDVEKTFTVKWGARSFTHKLPAGAVATFKWTGVQSYAPVGKVIKLKGFNNKYVTGQNGQQPMWCDRSTAGAWEKFTVVNAGGGKIALKSMNKYVSSENGTAPITCNRTAISDWEKFDWVVNADGTISLRGNNGTYISSENGTSAMTCNRTSVSGWEAFIVE